jgi:hypothetical protein
MAASIRLPTGELDEDRAIDLVATVLIPMVRHKLTPEFSREWLETTLQQGLREGQLSLTRHAIEAAEAGDEICDAALRRVFVEIVRGELPERRPGYLHIQVYGEHAVLRAPHKRPQGHRWHDDFVKNIQTGNLIYFVCREFGVSPLKEKEAAMGSLLAKFRHVTGRGLLSTSTSLLVSPMQPARCGDPVGVDSSSAWSIRAGLTAHSKVWSKKPPFAMPPT